MARSRRVRCPRGSYVPALAASPADRAASAGHGRQLGGEPHPGCTPAGTGCGDRVLGPAVAPRAAGRGGRRRQPDQRPGPRAGLGGAGRRPGHRGGDDRADPTDDRPGHRAATGTAPRRRGRGGRRVVRVPRRRLDGVARGQDGADDPGDRLRAGRRPRRLAGTAPRFRCHVGRTGHRQRARPVAGGRSGSRRGGGGHGRGGARRGRGHLAGRLLADGGRGRHARAGRALPLRRARADPLAGRRARGLPGHRGLVGRQRRPSGLRELGRRRRGRLRPARRPHRRVVVAVDDRLRRAPRRSAQREPVPAAPGRSAWLDRPRRRRARRAWTRRRC